MHVAPADDEFADIIEAVLAEDVLGHFHLLQGFRTLGLGHRREPDRAAAAAPVVEAELAEVGLALHQVEAVLQRLAALRLLGGDDLAAGSRRHRLDDLPVGVVGFLGAVEAGIHVPGADVVVLLDLAHGRIGDRAGAGVVVGTLDRGAGRFPQRMRDDDRIGNHHRDAQGAQRIDDLGDVGFVGVLDAERTEVRRRRHQPHAHLGHDAVVGLGEDAIERRPVAPLENLPGVRVRHRTHAGAQHVAIGQHHFHAAGKQEVLAVGRVADAAIDHVAQRAGNRRRRRAGEPQRQLLLLQVVVKLLVGDAGFDQSGAQIGIDFDDLVHALQIHDDLAALHRRRRTVAEVLAGRDRIDRDLVLVEHLEHGLDLLDAGGRDGRRGRVLVVGHRHHDLVVGGQANLIHHDVFGAKNCLELADRLVEFTCRDALGQSLALCAHLLLSA